jgi:copper chaperone CopZ
MNALLPQTKQRTCVGCRGATKSVEPVTIRALVRDEARAGLETDDGFRFCAAPDCEAVYSQPATGAVIDKQALNVAVFQKETNRARLVCYCFDHTVAELEQDAGLVAEIESKCRAGLDRCDVENPEGRCCLGNVRQVSGDGEAPPPTRDKGRWAAVGAVVAALLSSACCWLPLALIGVGVSAGGVGVFFEAYRWPFLAAASLMLVAGFYYVYVRKPACGPNGSCETPNPSIQRFNKLMLWVAAVFVAAFAFFPNYVGYVLAAGDAPSEAQAAETPAQTAAARGDVVRTYAVVGMSCEGCVAGIESTLRGLQGVSSVTVSYEDKLARVSFHGAANDARVLAAMDDLGYEASVSQTTSRGMN